MPKTRLFVTDLDRTLIDPEQAVDILDEIAAQKGYATRHSWVTVAHTRKGLDFDFFEYLETELHFSSEQIQALIQEALTHADPHRLFFGDTQAYLDHVMSQADTKLLILTYGRKRWQEFKLQLAGLEKYPHIITEDPDKGATIAHWQQHGQFVPPGYPELATEEVIAIDDKLSGLQGVPKGYLVDRMGKQDARKNDDILVVKDLRQVLTHERLTP